MSKKHKRRYGWTCPLCGIAYAPWVMSCECEKDEVPCSCQCGAPTEVDDQSPLVTESDHEDFYLPGGVVNLHANLQTLSCDNAALLDQLTRWREVCQQACGGSEELCAAVDDRCVEVHDEAVTLQRQQDAAIAELQDAQDFVADLDVTPEFKDFLRKHPFAVAQVRDQLESLASTDEGDSPPRTLRFEVKNMQTLEAEILQHQQDAATNPLPGYTEALQELREDGAVPSRKTDYE